MERVKCDLNSAHTADFSCECENPQVNFCVICLDEHFETAKTHRISRLPVSSTPVPTSDLCSVCHTNRTTDFCICHIPISPLCPLCRILHMSKEPSAAHRFLPLALKDSLRSEQDLTIVKHRLGALDSAERKLRQNIVEIATCEEKLREKGRAVIETIRDYRDETLQQIEDRRVAVKSGLEKEPATLRVGDQLQVFNWSDIIGLSWESRWSACAPVLPQFHLPQKDHFLANAAKAAETVLATGSVEQYLDAVEREIRGRRADIAEAELETYRAQAKVQYYREHWACAQAVDSAWRELDGKQATSLYPSRVKLRIDSVAALYQARLTSVVAANESLQRQLASVQLEIAHYKGSAGENTAKSRKPSRARSRSARNFPGVRYVSPLPESSIESTAYLETQSCARQDSAGVQGEGRTAENWAEAVKRPD